MDKSNQKNSPPQVHRLPAGILPGDFDTELIGDRNTRKVYGLSNGTTVPFAEINPALKASLFEMMLSDDLAMADLAGMDHEAALEEFTFCVYGAADHLPDFKADGTPGTADNFLCGANCRCLAWKSKCIMLNGTPLTTRQLEITKLMASDMPDKAIAAELGITPSTLDDHKRQLYKKAGVQSKPGLIIEAVNQKVIQ